MGRMSLLLKPKGDEDVHRYHCARNLAERARVDCDAEENMNLFCGKKFHLAE